MNSTFSGFSALKLRAARTIVAAWLFLMICLGFFCTFADAQNQTLDVIRLSNNPAADEVGNAKAAFQQGKAIVVLEGGDRTAASRLLGIDLPAMSPTSIQDKNPIPKGSVGAPEEVKRTAAYLDTRKMLHSLQAFAAANAPDASWQKATEDWIKKQQGIADGSIVGAPQPPSGAWTTMLTTTVSSTGGYGNTEQTDISVYRLNTIDTANDYYMVYLIPESYPNYNGFCDGIGDCGFHTFGRHFQLGLADAQLFEHGPGNVVNTTTVSFNFGGSVSSEGPGINTGLSVSWSQPDVTTNDRSNQSTGIWDEQFVANYFNHCDPGTGTLNETSYGTFFSTQLAILKVPAGITDLHFPIEDEATYCETISPYGIPYNVYDYTQNDTTIHLGAPVLTAAPSSLTVGAGQSQPLLVSAFIPFSTEGLSWKLSTNQSWLTVPGEGPYSGIQAIPVSVAPGTPNGTTGTIALDTYDPDATRSVVQGPILVNVTVGTPQTTTSSGVLLTGGEATQGSLARTSFYNLTTKEIEPVGQLQVGRYSHTATTLKNGDVVVIGGATNFNPYFAPLAVTGLAEVYHPASLAFSPSGTMLVPRQAHTATLLPDGKVLITGGIDGNGDIVQQAELYDPASGTFSAAGTTANLGGGSNATVISDVDAPTQVLVYGGNTAVTQIWSEASKAFTNGSGMAVQGYFPAPVLNSNGDYVLAGGADKTGETKQVQVFSPSSHDFQDASGLHIARFGNTLTKLSNGGLLTAGGAVDESATAELEASGASSWDLLSGGSSCPGNSGCMQEYRASHTATLLPDGTVLLVGGTDPDHNPTPTAEFFTPSSGQFTPGPLHGPQALHTANLISTSATTLQVSPSPASAGRVVTLVASVSVGVGTPSGTISFYDGGTLIGTVAVAAGGATLTTSTLSVGSHSLTATSEGSGVSASSTSAPVTEVITDDESAVKLVSSANPAGPSEGVRLTATISSSEPVTAGTVVFKDGSTTLATVNVTAGTATYTTTTLTVGTHPMTAMYSGDLTQQPSTSAVLNQVVEAESAATKLSVTPGTIAFGSAVVLSASVTGDGTPTGSITFSSTAQGGASVVLGKVSLTSGTASLSSSMLAVGQDTLTAIYSGDTTHEASTSAPVKVTVNPATPMVVVTSMMNPSTVGQFVTFFVKVSGGAVVPTGTVQFYDGSTPLGAVVTLHAGAASVTPPPLAKGAHTIIASYSGDGNYNSAGSAGLEQQVDGSATTTRLSSNPNPSAAGQMVGFVLSVTSSQGTPSGTVNILDGDLQIATVTLADGLAQYSTSTLAVGSHVMSAMYGGDSSRAGSTSTALTQVVQPAATSTNLSVAGNPVVGERLTFAATVIGDSPVGTVVFKDGATPLGSGNLAGGKATFATSTLAMGTHSIIASYEGQGNNASSTSSPLQVVVVQSTAAATQRGD